MPVAVHYHQFHVTFQMMLCDMLILIWLQESQKVLVFFQQVFRLFDSIAISAKFMLHLSSNARIKQFIVEYCSYMHC